MSTTADTARPVASTRACTVLAACALLASGCASYPERTRGALTAFESGRLEQAHQLFADPDTTRSAFLSGVEAGTAALAAGDWQAAIDDYERAARASKAIEDSALASVDNLSEALVSFTVSERLGDYVGEGYERVLLHAQMGLAYLAQGDLEGALVEARRGNKLLEREEELYEKEYGAGGLGHLLSAVVYELEGSLDDAYIDYKRMAEKDVGGRLVGRSLVRLASVLGRDDELPLWIERWGPPTPVPPGVAEIVVIAGVGMGPFKEEVTLTIPTGDGILQWSVPAYRPRVSTVSGLELVVEGSGQAIGTVVVEDVTAVAKENLDDRIAWLAARSAVRAVLKYQLTKHLEDRWRGAGLIAGSLFTLVTERADLRCWQTLPATFQAGRAFVEAGTHALTLRAVGGEIVDLGTYELVPGETLFVIARTVGSRLHAHPIGGLLVDELPPGQEATLPE